MKETELQKLARQLEAERLVQIGGTGEESAPEAAPESELSKPDTSKGAVEGATPTPNAEQAQQSGSVNQGQDGEANLAGNAPQGVPAQAAKGLSQVDQGNIAAGGAAAAASVVDQKAHAAATSLNNDLPPPSEAQKQAGNYKMGHLKVGGVAITVENPDGSQRTWKNEDTGEAGPSTIHDHYGYMKNTVGADGDHIDVNTKTGRHPNTL
jgi:hypothetical protein